MSTSVWTSTYKAGILITSAGFPVNDTINFPQGTMKNWDNLTDAENCTVDGCPFTQSGIVASGMQPPFFVLNIA